MKVDDPVTLKLSKDNYGTKPDSCPFRKWEWIKSQNNPFTKSKWGIIRWFQIIYYKIKYYERNSNRNLH